MVTLSLFDGMSCGQIALRELGIVPDIYYASEIDKYAIGQTQLNFPNTIQLGSVVDVDVSKLKPIDFLCGGSPCQSFSFAGKRKGMSTKCEIQITKLHQYLELKEQGFEFEGQSYLFWEYMRILTDIRKYNPDVKFLLENVEMGKKWERILSEAIGIFGVHINSNLVSAQNRARIYWTNISTEKRGLFGELYSDIQQPEDKGILLKDILEDEVDDKYYLSDKMLNGFANSNSVFKDRFKPHDLSTEKSYCITSRIHKLGKTDPYIDENICVAQRGREDVVLTPKRTEYGKQVRKAYEAGEITEQRKNIQQLEPRTDGKTNSITTVQKDNLVMQINPSKESGGKQPYQHNRVYDIGGIAPALNLDSRSPAIKVGNIYPSGGENGNIFSTNGKSPTIKSGETSTKGNGGIGSSNAPKIVETKDGLILEGMTLVENKQVICHNMQPRSPDRPSLKYSSGGSGHLQRSDGKTYCLDTGNTNAVEIPNSRIRRLTPTECARLQTIPDWYKWECSDTQQYRMLGNGWTIKVIEHIFSFL